MRIVDLVEFVCNVHFVLDTIDLIEDLEDISLFFFASFLHRSVVVIENSREIWSGAELTIITEAQDCECYDCEQMEGCAKAATERSNFSCWWENGTNDREETKDRENDEIPSGNIHPENPHFTNVSLSLSRTIL